MMVCWRYKSNWLTFATALLCATAAWSQPPAKPPVPPAAAPVAIPSAAQLDLETNPAVRAALELPRTEPKHYVSAVLALVDLGRPELAAPILKELLGLNLTDEQRAQLVSDFGSHRMLQLSKNAALAPAGQQFADACMAAAATKARDPQRIARLIGDLTNSSAVVRHAAAVDLAAAGQDGVNATLEALASETDPQRRAAISEAVVSMDQLAVGPLLAMLGQAAPGGAADAEVIRLLQALHVTQAAPLIAAYTGSPDATALLIAALDRYRRGTKAFVVDEDDQVELWNWCKGHLTASRLPAEEAQTIWMARLALALAKLRPDVRDYQQEALVLAFDAGLWDRTLDGTFAVCDLAVVDSQRIVDASNSALFSEVLAAAMKQNRARAAKTTADLLGVRGDAGVLLSAAPQPAALVNALSYPNRRVRFAALSAIMSLNPTATFPGASRVPETLGYFATSASERRAVVAMPIADQATTLAGQLTKLGIEAQAATQGSAAVRLAGKSADLDMILVDADIDAPGVRDVLFALRSTPATGQVPIGILATSERLVSAQQIAADHTRVVAFVRPQTDEATSEIATRLTALSARDQIASKERAAMAAQALAWLGELLAGNQSFYDLKRQEPVIQAALYQPELAGRSVAALALLGTPESQRALVEYASQPSVAIDARQQAAAAFQKSVARSGILLTEEEIRRQYDRYNASATADAETQKVLGAVLDALESVREKTAPRRNLSNVPVRP
jgi:CheY-like chemotaxis protein